jgi:hypothetical protein
MFVREGIARTPDILVDRAVEVECKYKVRSTDADRARDNLYKLLNQKLERLLKPPRKDREIHVEATFHNEPTRAQIDELASMAKSALQPKGPWMMKDTSGPLAYLVRASHLRPSANGYDILNTIPTSLRTNYDMVSVSGRMRDGCLSSKALLAVKCNVEQDRVKSLSGKLKNASGQFSKSKPAIIHVDVSDAVELINQTNVARTSEIINDFLRQHTSVSAVVVEANVMDRSSGSLVLSRGHYFFLNLKARHPLPTSLREGLGGQAE